MDRTDINRAATRGARAGLDRHPMDREALDRHPMDRDPGPGRDRRERGYCVAGERTWLRIRREFEGGASVAWLSARYGPGQRTIGAHAKAGGWRKKDLAARADAALDAAEWVTPPPPLVLPEVEGEAPGAPPDGVGLALNGAMAALRVGRVRDAQDYARLAEMLARVGRSEDGTVEAMRDPEAEDAAMRFLRARLGIERE